MHALQERISRLRSALPIELELRDGGYRLDPATFKTDAAQFESLYRRSGRLLADGDRRSAATCLHRALDLWRGPAFDGVTPITALQVEAVRLDTLYSAALADRIDLDLAQGEHASLLPELHALVAEQPFAERQWGQLMSAMYCDGRPQEALDVFARAREIFTECLGTEPSSELGRLHTGILREESPASLLRLPPPGTVFSASAPAVSDTGATPVRSLTSGDPETLVALLRHHRAVLLT